VQSLVVQNGRITTKSRYRNSDNCVRRQLNIFADDDMLTLLLERIIPPES